MLRHSTTMLLRHQRKHECVHLGREAWRDVLHAIASDAASGEVRLLCLACINQGAPKPLELDALARSPELLALRAGQPVLEGGAVGTGRVVGGRRPFPRYAR